MLYEQFEELKHTGKLPTPSGVGLRILVLTRSDECSVSEIAQTLQADPALTGRILKLANSALSAGVQPATNVRDAGVRLGLRTVCNVSLGFSLITGNRTGRCASFDYDEYWSWSLASAVGAEQLSRELRLGTPGEAFTLGLLARVGRLALASVHPELYAEVLEKLRADRKLDLAHLEREAFCINHREVAAAIAEDWGLPPLFAEVMLHCGVRVPETLDWPESHAYLDLLATAGQVAEVLTGGQRASALWPAAREALVQVGVAPEDCQRLYDEIGDRWREWGKLLQVPADFEVRAREIEANVPPPAQDRGNKESPSLRILAVDDEPTSLRLVVSLLEREGHKVTTARNGQDALKAALESPPQMVVTDWMMPAMDGVELCKQLRRNDAGRDLYILILTGQSEEQRVVEAFEAGADDHVAKPVNPKLLLARIRPGIRVIQLQERLQDKVRETEVANARLAIANRRSEQASMTDALTELPNRRYAMKRLDKEWAAFSRSGLPLSVVLLDIDHFKNVNDDYGHDVGDQVLRATARCVQRVLRTSDTCTRIGGEEFLVICPGTNQEGAQHLAERIRVAIEGNQVLVPGFDRGRVTASLGVSCSADTGIDSMDALLKAADEGVYQSKRTGRNKASLAPPPRDERKSA